MPQANNLISRRSLLKSSTVLVGAAAVSPLWSAPKRYDVIIIGAGLAGLHSAYLLEQAGLNVLVLESSERVGGRVYTLDQLDGYPEIGANQVGMDYEGVRNIAQRLNVPIGAGQGMLPGMTFALNQQTFDATTWGEHSANMLNAIEKSLQPGWLLWTYLAKGEGIASPLGWLAPDKKHLDIPLVDYLKSMKPSPEALRLMNTNFLAEDINEVSALHMIRKNAIVKNSRGAEFITGGSQRLPDAMAKALKSGPVLEHKVQSISQQGQQLAVMCTNGAEFVAGKVIIAAPFSTAKQIDIKLPLSTEKRQIISNMGYSSVIHVFFRPTEAYWETDKLSPNMWTDTPAGMVFSQLEKDKVVRIRAWVMGKPAQQLDQLPEKEVADIVRQAIEQARPAAKGKLELETVFSWKKYQHNQGAISYFKAGDVSAYASLTAKPEGQLHFAGEHTDYAKSGMEAAILSAERVAKEIISG